MTQFEVLVDARYEPLFCFPPGGVGSGEQRGRDAVLSEVCPEGVQGGTGSCSQEDRIWWRTVRLRASMQPLPSPH